MGTESNGNCGIVIRSNNNLGQSYIDFNNTEQGGAYARILCDTNNKNLHFGTGGTDEESMGTKMTLTDEGKLGIGTTAPCCKLTVVGDTKLDGSLNVTGNANIAGNLTVTGDLTGNAATATDLFSSLWTKRGSDIDGEAGSDESGYSVSLSDDGSIVAIGAKLNDDNGNESGHVRVYQWDGTAWNQRGDDIVGEASDDQSGYSVSLNSYGNIVAIGAIKNSHDYQSGLKSGHVRVYHWDGTSWEKMGSDIDGESRNDESGYSVSLSAQGNIVAIGAKLNDGPGNDSGHVRVYQWNGTAWTKRGNDIDGEASYDQSGYSVSLSDDGTIVAIGAKLNDGPDNDSGHVRVYQWDGTAWNQRGNDIDGEYYQDQSGWSVSLNGDGTIVAIGAISNDDNGVNSGHVRVYQWDGTAWNQRGDDIVGEASNDESGYSVSLSANGNIVAIGAINNTSSKGHVRVYHWDETSWERIGSDIDGEVNGDKSGWSVSLNGDGTIVAIGAISNDDNGVNSGHVRVYEYNHGKLRKFANNINYDGSVFYGNKTISGKLTINGQADKVNLELKGAIKLHENGISESHPAWNNRFIQLYFDRGGYDSNGNPVHYGTNRLINLNEHETHHGQDHNNPQPITFTGQHRNYGINEIINNVGFIVRSTGNYRNQMKHCDECNKHKISINESLPIVEYPSTSNDKAVWGVISNKDDSTEETHYSLGGGLRVAVQQEREDRPLIINSLGEGAMWVTNLNGAIENGDYMTSSLIPGLAMRQNDDLLHNYTVAKITMDCNFDDEQRPAKQLRYENRSNN